jgi:hypothetical protein
MQIVVILSLLICIAFIYLLSNILYPRLVESEDVKPEYTEGQLYFLFPWIYPFWTFYIYGIICNVAFFINEKKSLCKQLRLQEQNKSKMGNCLTNNFSLWKAEIF